MKTSSGYERLLIQCLESLTGLSPKEQANFNNLIALIKQHDIQDKPADRNKISELMFSICFHYPELRNESNVIFIEKLFAELNGNKRSNRPHP